MNDMLLEDSRTMGGTVKIEGGVSGFEVDIEIGNKKLGGGELIAGVETISEI